MQIEYTTEKESSKKKVVEDCSTGLENTDDTESNRIKVNNITSYVAKRLNMDYHVANKIKTVLELIGIIISNFKII